MLDLNIINKALSCKIIKKIEKGWSEDLKFIIIYKNEKCLLRLTPGTKKERKAKEINWHIQLQYLPINIPKVLKYGYLEDINYTYCVLTWVKGQDAEQVLPNLSANIQYDYGFSAGVLLSKLHTKEIANYKLNWETRFNNKVDKKIESYKACGYKIKSEEKFLGYLNTNRFLLVDRPQVIQHGDYHIGNMVIDDNYNVGLIDLNRIDIGDPWEEFNRIVFTSMASPLCAKGMINGYFNNKVPKEFFQLLLYYITCNIISHIPWSINYGNDELKVALKLVNTVLEDYDDFNIIVPKWYSN